MRLAVPTGLGEQGPLIEGGLDAVRISSTGELPPPPDGTTPRRSISRPSATSGAPPSPWSSRSTPLRPRSSTGPDAYVGVAGNLMPGWALAMLAIVLLLPVAAASFVAVADAAHSPWQPPARSAGPRCGPRRSCSPC